MKGVWYMKKIIVLVLVSLMTFVLYSCTNKEKESTTEKTEEQEVYQISEKTPKLVRTEAKTDDYETLQKLEEKSPIILLVQKKKEIKSEFGGNENAKIPVGTLSSVKVIEVIKNESKEKIEQNQIVSVLESEVYDRDDNTLYRVNDYSMMQENGQYFLYVRKSETDNEFLILGVTLGKVEADTKNAKPGRLKTSKLSGEIEKLHKAAYEKNKKYLKK